MISFHNDKMVAETLCKLLYDAVPEQYHVPTIFSYGRRHMPASHERVLGVTDYKHVWLNLESIAFGGSRSCAPEAGIWYKMLETGFHEFGHIALAHWRTDVPEDDYAHYRHVEQEADNWANERMAAILRWDDRLFQPDYLGVITLVQRRLRKRARQVNDCIHPGSLKDWRCYKTGGQLSVGDVVYRLFRASSWEDPRLWRRYVRQVHRVADDLARPYVDSAGRRHHFWTWGDLPRIAERFLMKGGDNP